MNKFVLVFATCILGISSFAQATRVAILDFENISGIAKYDGLGKAMSSMLISDIESNVSPKRLQLVERAQIQKILKEQNFQASGSVNKSTAVQAGKILGVNYLLVGDIYILNDQLIINARLTNTETGDIVFSKKQEGKIVGWLTLKTNIAKDLAASLSQPFTEPTIPDKEIPVATITTFGNAVTAKDTGNVQMAETLTTTILDFSPDFKYVDDLRKEIDELKKQVNRNTQDIEYLKNSGDLVINAKTLKEFENNLKSDLLSLEKKSELFIEMIKSHADTLIHAPPQFMEYGYEVYFANQLDYNCLNLIESQMLELEKLTSINQKILLARHIRGELIFILNKYNWFYNSSIDVREIDENKLLATIGLFKKCLAKYRIYCFPDISNEEINFLDLFVPYDIIKYCYVQTDIFGTDTIYFNSQEYIKIHRELITEFIVTLKERYKIDYRITESLLQYTPEFSTNKSFQFLILFIYFQELEKQKLLSEVKKLNPHLGILPAYVGSEYYIRSYNDLNLPLIINQTGVDYNENSNK
jgi:TolB-like protein